MSRVIVVGSVNMDVVVRVGRHPAPGETVTGGDVAFIPGGKGANQAVAARRLGAETTLYAAVGADAFGRQSRDSLAAAGVRAEHVVTIDGAPTGVALIEVADDGENTIVVSPGANHRLGPPPLDDLTPTDIVVLQLEIPLDTCVAVARSARRAGARVILNAAPAPTGIDGLLPFVDVLVVNETEAYALLGAARQDWPEATRTLCDRGPAACVVTLGGEGAVAADRAGPWAQPAFPATVVDTTGAGDAFCGALAAALAHGKSLRAAVRDGCAAGAIATGRLGARSALPTIEDLERHRA